MNGSKSPYLKGEILQAACKVLRMPAKAHSRFPSVTEDMPGARYAGSIEMGSMRGQERPYLLPQDAQPDLYSADEFWSKSFQFH